MIKLAPIVLFIYNRPIHTKKTIDSLLKNPLAAHSELFVYADGPKRDKDIPKVNEVRQIVNKIKGFTNVHLTTQDKNKGLADSVISGVSEVINIFGKAIVIEDDLISTSNFLNFMNDCLDFYANTPHIFSISGYIYPFSIPTTYQKDVLLLPRSSSWGWATWKDRWAKADWTISNASQIKKDKALQESLAVGGSDLIAMLYKQKLGKIDSWSVRWSYTHLKHQAYGLFPVNSKIYNIGNDASGTHSDRTSKYDVILKNTPYQLTKDLTPQKEIITSFQKFFEPSLYRKIINKIRYGV